MADVVLQNVSKAFKGPKGERICAVNDFSLAVREGEFVAVVGPSGCGKTTLLRLIAGLEQMDSGIISMAGQVINDWQPKDRDIAMIFQNYALYPHMTVGENLAFPLRLRKTAKPETRLRVQEVAELLGIADLLERKPDSLSGGQRQRVALGRAIIRRPKVFLFDEPLSNLDAKLRVQMRSEIARLHARLGSTMIYVTHDQTEALTMGERIVVMKDGAIQQVAGPAVIYDQPATMFVADFLGSPAMNFFEGRLIAKSAAWRFQELPGGLSLAFDPTAEQIKSLASFADRPVVLGIRPEHLSILQDFRDSVPAVVELIERLGAETLVQVCVGASSCTLRLGGASQVALGQKVMLKFDLTKAHFFDPQSHRRIA